jgi:hypothetical protein
LLLPTTAGSFMQRQSEKLRLAFPHCAQGDSMFGRVPGSLVNAKRPETLVPYLSILKERLVLRVKCMLSSVMWNTPVCAPIFSYLPAAAAAAAAAAQSC